MSAPKSKNEQDAINYHIGEAHKAAQVASAYLSDAVGPTESGMTPEQLQQLSYFRTTVVTAATRVADTHTRLLKLRLAIGDTAF